MSVIYRYNFEIFFLRDKKILKYIYSWFAEGICISETRCVYNVSIKMGICLLRNRIHTVHILLQSFADCVRDLCERVGASRRKRGASRISSDRVKSLPVASGKFAACSESSPPHTTGAVPSFNLPCPFAHLLFLPFP